MPAARCSPRIPLETEAAPYCRAMSADFCAASRGMPVAIAVWVDVSVLTAPATPVSIFCMNVRYCDS